MSTLAVLSAVTRKKGHNPSIQIRSVRTSVRSRRDARRQEVTIPQYRSGQFGRRLPSWRLDQPFRSHNPSIQIRSVRTTMQDEGGWLKDEEKSQSLNTDQVSSDSFRRACASSWAIFVTIPQYRSGQFGHALPLAFVLATRKSQSLNTDQVSSDPDRNRLARPIRAFQKSQSLNTDQVSSDPAGRLSLRSPATTRVTIPQYRSGQFGPDPKRRRCVDP